MSKRWAAIGLAVATGLTAAAPAAAAEPAVTRAALDPALTEGRGADVGFLEQEAEHATTDGTVIGPGRAAYTLPSEASGRMAVRLAPGQSVDFVLPAAANAITVRYSIPDAPSGGGITAPLDVIAGDDDRRRMTLTSEYAWLYNQYPFTNDPDADLLHPDWWITECQCVPAATTPAPVIEKPFRPTHFYDEQRLMLRHRHAAGTRIRLAVPATSTAEWTVIDLLDSELVPKPAKDPHAVSVVRFGADKTGRRDSAAAFEAAIAFARAHGRRVHIPEGTFQVNRHIVVDDVTITGAGSWYSIVRGEEVALDEPLPDGSVHTGVGFYGKPAAEGGSSDVHLSGFAIEGDVRERIDLDQVNGIGGALSDSTIDGLYIHHTKVGIWLDGPMDDVRITDTVITDQIADGVNFHTGVTDSVVENTFVRNSGDDALAMWSEDVANARNAFVRNTVQSPVLANGIAIYGGTDTTIEGNLVADPVREGSGIHLGSRFGAEPFTGHQWITGNTTVRAGVYDLNWNIGLGLDLVLRAGGRSGLRRARDRRPLPGQHLQRDHVRLGLAGEGPLLDLERPLQGRQGRRHGHLRGQRAGGRVGVVRERRRAQRRRRRDQQLRLVPLHAGRLGVLADRPRRQRRRRDDRPVVRRLATPEHDHLRRPAAGGAAATALPLVTAAARCPTWPVTHASLGRTAD